VPRPRRTSTPTSEPRLLAINLDSAAARWAGLVADAAAHGLVLERVAAVDGRAVLPPWDGFDAREFARRTGRRCLGGEYGCHRSHLAALRGAALGSAEWSVVLEDDVRFLPDSAARLAALLDLLAGAGPVAVKLASHRIALFRTLARSAAGDLGLPLVGPGGSAAAYLVNRAGARVLAESLAVMREPFDVALEAHWRHPLRFLCLRRNLVLLDRNPHNSTLLAGDDYLAAKFPRWQRLPRLPHRAAEAWRRAVAGLRAQRWRRAQ
jgi:glycosyl transferase, family 25